jgi:hypothetical protein
VLSALEMIDCPVLAADLVHHQWLSTGKIRKTANQITTTIIVIRGAVLCISTFARKSAQQ